MPCNLSMVYPDGNGELVSRSFDDVYYFDIRPIVRNGDERLRINVFFFDYSDFAMVGIGEIPAEWTQIYVEVCIEGENNQLIQIHPPQRNNERMPNIEPFD